MQRRTFQVAIDGPVGAGKSTVAKLTAERLRFVFIDTGAMYRCVALAAKRRNVDWKSEREIAKLAKKLEISLIRPRGARKDGRQVTVLLNGEDVSWEIRKPELGEGASVVSQYPEVREEMVALQQKMANGTNVIMEGRDIGTRVLPKAQLKIYMDASLGERVKRKQEQLRVMGQELPARTVKEQVVKRDTREMTREVDPLRPAEEAWMLDTTGLSVDQVVDIICQKVMSLKGDS